MVFFVRDSRRDNRAAQAASNHFATITKLSDSCLCHCNDIDKCNCKLRSESALYVCFFSAVKVSFACFKKNKKKKQTEIRITDYE
jgi:hypothetical protein